jgi:hypothetical protein
LVQLQHKLRSFPESRSYLSSICWPTATLDELWTSSSNELHLDNIIKTRACCFQDDRQILEGPSLIIQVSADPFLNKILGAHGLRLHTTFNEDEVFRAPYVSGAVHDALGYGSLCFIKCQILVVLVQFLPHKTQATAEQRRW